MERGNGGNQWPPSPPASDELVAAAYHDMDAEIKDFAKSNEREIDAPVPPAQTAATWDEMERAIKRSNEVVGREDEAPPHPAQTAAAWDEMERAIKGSKEVIEREDGAPQHPSQTIDGLQDEFGDGENETVVARKNQADLAATLNDENNILSNNEAVTNMRPLPVILSMESPPPAPAGQNATLPVRPPPPSMLPRPNSDNSTSMAVRPSSSSMPQVEAVAVDHTVYLGVQVPNNEEPQLQQTWFTKHKQYIYMCLCLFLGLAVAVPVAISNRAADAQKESLGTLPPPAPLADPAAILRHRAGDWRGRRPGSRRGRQSGS